MHMYPIKEEDVLPEEKRVAEAIQWGIRSRLKAYHRCINNNIRKYILNYYYSVDNDISLCDKAGIFQS